MDIKPTFGESSRTNILDSSEDSSACESEGEKENALSDKQRSVHWGWTVEHVLLPTIRTVLLPSHTMCFPTKDEKSPSLLKLTSLPDLYKVFERC